MARKSRSQRSFETRRDGLMSKACQLRNKHAAKVLILFEWDQAHHYFLSDANWSPLYFDANVVLPRYSYTPDNFLAKSDRPRLESPSSSSSEEDQLMALCRVPTQESRSFETRYRGLMKKASTLYNLEGVKILLLVERNERHYYFQTHDDWRPMHFSFSLSRYNYTPANFERRAPQPNFQPPEPRDAYFQPSGPQDTYFADLDALAQAAEILDPAECASQVPALPPQSSSSSTLPDSQESTWTSASSDNDSTWSSSSTWSSATSYSSSSVSQDSPETLPELDVCAISALEHGADVPVMEAPMIPIETSDQPLPSVSQNTKGLGAQPLPRMPAVTTKARRGMKQAQGAKPKGVAKATAQRRKSHDTQSQMTTRSSAAKGKVYFNLSL
ncbi:uncharacterized protein B0I36DRAFT_320674 [Microdochium trichocladiopsis]|uniref:MADS-box domain-containing protein n=1 Tax=Microdochium trichocladiopsis TaxID=1682393 RepID=A0A9P9BPE5_9PEZI|nr:uncharacterized protein B0I36DRAFT_320674 [Microdochium trichocladiopsis]KAH7033054.1 hypothetical protein B0I36DRAFT_320674 [Microdochium trichocladiopsis]